MLRLITYPPLAVFIFCLLTSSCVQDSKSPTESDTSVKDSTLTDSTDVDTTEYPPPPITLYDLFPLKVGFKYRYSFFRDYGETSQGNTWLNQDDSGIVEYEILSDSQTSETLRLWSIKETKTLSRHHSGGSHIPPSQFDSTFSIESVTVFPLYETLEGNHALTCSSLVWNSPVLRGGRLNLWRSVLALARFNQQPQARVYLTAYTDWDMEMLFDTSRGYYRYDFTGSRSSILSYHDQITIELKERYSP